jgi:hypothetical protein
MYGIVPSSRSEALPKRGLPTTQKGSEVNEVGMPHEDLETMERISLLLQEALDLSKELGTEGEPTEWEMTLRNLTERASVDIRELHNIVRGDESL